LEECVCETHRHREQDSFLSIEYEVFGGTWGIVKGEAFYSVQLSTRQYRVVGMAAMKATRGNY